jgi:hypothetical protein
LRDLSPRFPGRGWGVGTPPKRPTVERHSCGSAANARPRLRLAVIGGIVTAARLVRAARRGARCSEGFLRCAPWRWEARYGAGMAITPKQREALRMLAGSPDGCTVTTLMARGYAIVALHDLVRNGFATAHRENVGAGQRVVGVTRLRITDAGRRAVAE